MAKTSTMLFLPPTQAAVYSGKPEVALDGVEGLEQVAAGVGSLHQRAAEAELRHRAPRELDRDRDGRDHERDDEHDVLRDLGVGDAAHPARHGVHEHEPHADQHADLDGHLEEAREHDPHPAHLARDVGEGHEDRAEHRDDPCRLGVVPIAHELGHGEAPELAQVGGEQEREQHVAPGPAHQVDAALVAHEGDEAGHRDERGRAHPVGGGRHPVRHRGHAAPRDVEARGRGGATPDRDPDVEAEREPDDRVGPGENAHGRLSRRRVRDRVASSTTHTRGRGRRRRRSRPGARTRSRVGSRRDGSR